ncbi:LacI family DNA-binding transcriptional regulator [Cellulomonas edaphi]|uniref:LacI family DNA-binding transcriptional regulator n=1 Tax=Cellulomonas edaphi TaxID=3053468 RepID=A0ABT7S2B7_9CELL|nr:LacI family DNA-binding transcriptional regulator [Cellulomons edaphi]MDM7829751.1 LacI family DNA-binding transcriptional regulator [Cellulomons edaphi]
MGDDRSGAVPPADDLPHGGAATLEAPRPHGDVAARPVGSGETPERTGGAPTLEDVARVAGVSRATVSRVVNGKRRVAQDIQDVVRQAIATVGYVPNLAARSLVTRRTGAVVVVVSGAEEAAADGSSSVDFADPFFGRVVGGMLRALRPRDVDPILMLAETDADRNRVISALSNGNADGALLVSTHAEDPLPALLVEAGMPAVQFARPAHPLPMSYVDVANRDGARLAAAHLVERGRRRIVAISGPLDVPAARDRLSGFEDELARHGHAWVPSAAGNFTFASGVVAMDRLLDQEPAVDGVFASNDLMALGAIEALHARGRHVPHDVSVVGFDDSSLGAHSRPGLTSVRQPIEEMAAEMARILLDTLADPERRVTSVIFEPTLVVRGTS